MSALSRAGRRSAAPPRVPPGRRIYAVGDIHGRADLLATLQELILQDAQGGPGERTIVYLGDYIDRGKDSAGVIDRLLTDPLPGFGTVFLRGNHEQCLLDFLEDTRIGPHWLSFGGDRTLASYGVAVAPGGTDDARALLALQAELRARLPARHLSFYRGLRSSHAAGDYFFVHAGVRPGVPLAAQAAEDLLWIREPFLSDGTDHGKVVVHGHTIGEQVEIRANRIGIDTGAYFSGHLTALALEGQSRRVLST